MTFLGQILAVEKGVKSQTTTTVTGLHRDVQKLPLLSGISRTYLPRAEDGDQLPSESTRVQITADQALTEACSALTRMLDVTFAKDEANQRATSSVVVDGRVLIESAPVTFLLALEKTLVDVRTFVSKIPTLDPAEVWTTDDSQLPGVYRTDPTRTMRTKKVPRNHVKAEATDRHPAQVEVYYEDVPVGDWTTVKFSGALPQHRRSQLLSRIDALTVAVKQARELANQTEVTSRKVMAPVFDYLLETD